MAIDIKVSDLAVFAAGIDAGKAQAMIDDALAMAYRAAPCLKDGDLDEETEAVAKAIIRGAVLRWNDAGTGAVTTQSTLDFSQTIDNRNPRKSLFWPSEIRQLSGLCGRGSAFSIDLAPSAGGSSILDHLQ